MHHFEYSSSLSQERPFSPPSSSFSSWYCGMSLAMEVTKTRTHNPPDLRIDAISRLVVRSKNLRAEASREVLLNAGLFSSNERRHGRQGKDC